MNDYSSMLVSLPSSSPSVFASIAVEEAVRIITGGAPELAVEGNGPVEVMQCSRRLSKGPTDSDEDEEKELWFLPSMTFTEQGSRSGSVKQVWLLPRKKTLILLPLSHMFKDNALLQGSWKQSCIVVVPPSMVLGTTQQS